jgi:hypothetical protein
MIPIYVRKKRKRGLCCLLGERYRSLFLLGIILILSSVSSAQVETATISGVITDQSGAVVAGVEARVTNTDTNVTWTSVSNGSGVYLVTGLKPGRYRIHIAREGFKGIDVTDLILNVQDSVSRNFTLQVGSTSESVSVEGDAMQINMQDASVSTVVDQQFVQNMPLNGRSFQTLIVLTPGVVLTPASAANPGQFSVNGQRTDSNYFTLDGVSANVGVSGGGGLGQTAGGALPGFSAQGGTNSLVSVDAMQEFRIQTSSFAPEFGNSPGGQIAIVTRSGGKDFHGTLFDYFRNDVLDANDWFANKNGLRKPPERQNDFGGVFGGPLIKSKTFFFFSYEGLRLRQPASQEAIVPDSALRQSAPAAMQPFLNAFPVQNGPDLGNGLAQFNASYSNPSTLDSYSIRIDHNINSNVSVFGRYNYAPSKTESRPVGAPSDKLVAPIDTQTFTLGSTQSISARMSNELRANYSNYRAGSSDQLDSFGGAVPPPDSVLFPAGFSSRNGIFLFDLFGGFIFLQGRNATNEQRQVNFVDNVSFTVGTHQTKFGIDYRWLAPFGNFNTYEQLDGFFSTTDVLSGSSPFVLIAANQSNALLSRNFSLYGQDTWKATRQLTFTYGIRWTVNPPLKGKNSDSEPFAVIGLNNPQNLSLAPRGSPLYDTTYGNVAPRLGLAYQLGQRKGWDTVLRGGFGLFYDLGTGNLGNVTLGFPYTANKFLFNVPIPLTPQEAAPPAFSQTPPVRSSLYVTVPDLKLPRTYQWNAAVEQSLGPSQIVSLTYVGAIGRNLLHQYFLRNPNPNFSSVFVTDNAGTADYHSLQVKFQRRLSAGLQVLSSYTFSHSIDNSSDDSGLFTPPSLANSNVDRGNSDFDVRHSFTGALTYNIPFPKAQKLANAILGDWSVETFVIARSALPINIYGAASVVAGQESQARPDVAPGIPLYLYGSQCAAANGGAACPGGKAINFTPGAVVRGCADGSQSVGPFCPPPTGKQGNFGRNVLRGFQARQADFAVRRQFHVTEKVNLQFRSEFFNILNHPNFGDPTMSNSLITSPLFGQSTETLATRLGRGGVVGGGFNPLYQVGGPRSIQLALKLQF